MGAHFEALDVLIFMALSDLPCISGSGRDEAGAINGFYMISFMKITIFFKIENFLLINFCIN